MINRTAQFLNFTLCLMVLVGCGKKAADEIDSGALKDSIYQNEYFGLSVPVPPEWSVQDQETRQRLVETGRNVMAGDDKRLKAVMKASEPQTVYLLAAFKHPVGTPVRFNPSIMCVAERVRDLPGVKRGKDYHFHARKLMESSQMNIEFSDEVLTEKLDGIEFDVMNVSMTIGAVTVQQKYYASIIKGYALLFIASFTTAEDEAALRNVLEGVSFK